MMTKLRAGCKTSRAAVALLGLAVLVWPLRAEDSSLTAVQLVRAMVANEDEEGVHQNCYEFVSEERSDRTGGHLWKERVVETDAGRVRMLLAVDGTPLRPEEVQKERDRLGAIMADPATFIRKEQAAKDDEVHARQMLDMLPRAFVFDNVRLAAGVWRMDFHPNPAYSPSGLQERVLYGMSGWVEIDARQQRLVRVEGRLPQDVSIGFGILATVKAGSHFGSDRREVGGHWRTVHVVTDIRGKAVLFKSVAKNSDITRSEFRYLDAGETIPDAVMLVERNGG
jgi:hypothetical protein